MKFAQLTRWLFTAPLFLITSVSTCFAGVTAQQLAGTTSLAPMLNRITDAVVNISVEKEVVAASDPSADNPDMHPTKSMAVGSGVILDAEHGYIVTNEHIVRNQKVMLITLKDGRRYRARLVGESHGFDLAVLQIQAGHLTAMHFGNSSKLNVGDFVVAIGSPYGLSQTVTSGVISALNRSTPKIEGFQDFIQTDASINPGNSGGALSNMRGELIGINTAIITPNTGNIGIGFAIPSNTVKIIAEQLIKYGKVSPGVLGVMAQDLTPELADALNLKNQQGVVVTQVLDGSPAAKAKIQSEDVITQINQNLIRNSAELHNLMGVTHPGTPVRLQVLRQGKPLVFHLTVADPSQPLEQRFLPYLSGLRLQNFSDLEPDSTQVTGVMVLEVNDTSAGAMAGLAPGDIITKANGQSISSVSQLIELANQAEKNLLLKVIRNNTNAFLVIQPDQ